MPLDVMQVVAHITATVEVVAAAGEVLHRQEALALHLVRLRGLHHSPQVALVELVRHLVLYSLFVLVVNMTIIKIYGFMGVSFNPR